MRPHPELIAARHNIALGKLDAFDAECERIAELASAGKIDPRDAIDALHDAADANSLTDTFGPDFIASLVAQHFAPEEAERTA